MEARADDSGYLYALPHPDGDWDRVISERCHEQLARAAALRDRLARNDMPDAEVLDAWNGLASALVNAVAASMTLRTVHPDPAIREQAAEAEVACATFQAEVNGDPRLLAVLSRVDRSRLDPAAARMLDLSLLDLRRGGTGLGDEDRRRVTEITGRLAELCVEYQRVYTDDVRVVRLPVEGLEGVPGTVRSRFAVDNGQVDIPATFANLVVASSSRVSSTRSAVAEAFFSSGWPANAPNLGEILRLRGERARLLGLSGATAYDAETKTLGTPEAAREFLAATWNLTRPFVQDEVAALTAEKSRDAPHQGALRQSDVQFYLGEIRRERAGVDPREVAQYLRGSRVKAGLLETMSRLFSVDFVERDDVGRWHPDVEVYDVVDAGELIGRCFLDLTERPGKNTWPQHVALCRGVAGEQLPQSVLVATVPVGAIDHQSAAMLFHELGHALHSIFSGRQRWARFSGVANERDFIEAPSTLLEDLVLEPEIIRALAVDDEGNPMPGQLLRRLRAATALGRAYFITRQLQLANLALLLHEDPAVDLDDVALRVASDMGHPVDLSESRHMLGSWMQIADERYASAYYSYVVSFAISRDLLSGFSAGLLDPAAWRRYRETVLAPGASKPALELVSDFLGRPFDLEPLERWLAEGLEVIRDTGGEGSGD